MSLKQCIIQWIYNAVMAVSVIHIFKFSEHMQKHMKPLQYYAG